MGVIMRYALALAVTFALSCCFSIGAFANKLPDVSNPSHYLHRVGLFRMMPPSKDSIVFLGDSLTERCDWAELFGNPAIKNRGISTDTTAGVLGRLGDIIAMKPRRIFLMVGINDIIDGRDVTYIAGNYDKILSVLRAALPKTEIYVQSVLPIAHNREVNDKVAALNSRLVKLAKADRVHYIDLFRLFKTSPDGLGPAFSMDGVHLTGEAYDIWRKGISSYVR